MHVPDAYGEGAVPQQRSTDHFELKPAQQRVLGVLKSEGSSRLTRARYEELSGVGRSQAAYDLAELVEKGVLERVGSGRATRYRIVHLSTRRQDGRRRWTQERIRAALEEFCAGRDAWPSATEFKQTGRFDLYVAASRYGGIPFWTSELGLTREPQPAPPRGEAAAQDVPATAAVGPAAAVAALALALAGAGHVRLSHGGAVVEAAPPQLLDASLKPPAVRQPTRHVQTGGSEAGRSPGPREASAHARHVDVDRAGLVAVERAELVRAAQTPRLRTSNLVNSSDELVEPRAASRAFRRQRPPPTSAPAARQLSEGDRTCVAARCESSRRRHLLALALTAFAGGSCCRGGRRRHVPSITYAVDGIVGTNRLVSRQSAAATSSSSTGRCE